MYYIFGLMLLHLCGHNLQNHFFNILPYRENAITAKIAHKIVDYSVKISNFPIEQENMKMLKCFYADETKL